MFILTYRSTAAGARSRCCGRRSCSSLMPPYLRTCASCRPPARSPLGPSPCGAFRLTTPRPIREHSWWRLTGSDLLYSGDLRAHGRQRHLFDELPEAAGAIDVLVLEGTTVGQPQGSHGFADEEDVEIRLSELLRHDGGLVVVIASGQNIDRAVSVYRAALAAGRELVIDPYQAYVLMTLRDVCPEAPQFDWPSVRVKFIQYHVAKLKDAGFWDLACKMSRAGKVTSEQLAANPSGFVYLARSSGATVDLLRYLATYDAPNSCLVTMERLPRRRVARFQAFVTKTVSSLISSIPADTRTPRIWPISPVVFMQGRWSQSTRRRPRSSPISSRMCGSSTMAKRLRSRH